MAGKGPKNRARLATRNDLSKSGNVRQRRTTQGRHKFESAGEFVEQVATELGSWLQSMTQSGASAGKRWVLSATSSSGLPITVHRLCAHGRTLIKLEGILPDGTACMFLAHHHSVQLLAYHVPEKTDEPPKREIGFHTGIHEIKIAQ